MKNAEKLNKIPTFHATRTLVNEGIEWRSSYRIVCMPKPNLQLGHKYVRNIYERFAKQPFQHYNNILHVK